MIARRMAVVTAVLGILLLGTACTPQQIAFWKAAHPPAASGGCVDAMHQVFPPSTWGWAMGIMKRESGFSPTAKNPRSTASGCFQLLSIHAHRFPGGWANRFNALANCQAAYSLYREAGTSPWRL
jgi:hypothetical protein